MSLSEALLRPFATVHLAIKVIVFFIGAMALLLTPLGGLMFGLQNAERIWIWINQDGIFKFPKTDEDMIVETFKQSMDKV
jgi:hypothetical protein